MSSDTTSAHRVHDLTPAGLKILQEIDAHNNRARGPLHRLHCHPAALQKLLEQDMVRVAAGAGAVYMTARGYNELVRSRHAG